MQRLLDPEQAVGLEQLGAADGGVGVPDQAHVQHEVDIVADGPADRLDIAQVLRLALPEGLPAEFHAGMAGVDRMPGARHGRLDAELEHVGGIDPHPVAQRPAEQVDDRAAEGLALEVPERDVDAGHGLDHGTVAAVVDRGAMHLDQSRPVSSGFSPISSDFRPVTMVWE